MGPFRHDTFHISFLKADCSFFSICAHAFYENEVAEAEDSFECTRTQSLVCLISSREGLLLAAILSHLPTSHLLSLPLHAPLSVPRQLHLEHAEQRVGQEPEDSSRAVNVS